MLWNVMIDGHTLEFKDSSGLDPWTKDYCREHDIPLLTTGSVSTFALLDNDCIYRMDCPSAVDTFQKMYERGEIKNFHDILSFLFNRGMLEKRMCHISPLYETNKK